MFSLPGLSGIQRRAPVRVGAVHFSDALGGDVIRPGTVYANNTTWSVCFWMKLTIDKNNYAAGFAYEEAGHSTNYVELITDSDGTTMVVYDDIALRITVGSMVVNKWYFIAMSVSNTTATIYMAGEGDPRFIKRSGTVTIVGTRNQISIGGTNFAASEYLVGDMAQVRAWNAVLSEGEFLSEYLSPTLVRTDNILGWWQLQNVATMTTDSSTAGNTLTKTGFPAHTDTTGPLIG